MGLEKTKPLNKTLMFRTSEEYHAEVVKFCNDRNWNMSKFLNQAIDESMAKVIRNENRKKSK